MRKEILAENFKNASKGYTDLQGALLEMFEEDPIMSCLIGRLNRLADDYYTAMMAVYHNGYTMDEVLGMDSRREAV